jgi:hypothetical protein
MFVIIDAHTVFRILCIVKFVFYLRIKFHFSCCSGPLFIPLRKCCQGRLVVHFGKKKNTTPIDVSYFNQVS